MALGRNLKRQKLIPDEEKAAAKKSIAKTVADSKPPAKKKTTKQPASKKASARKGPSKKPLKTKAGTSAQQAIEKPIPPVEKVEIATKEPVAPEDIASTNAPKAEESTIAPEQPTTETTSSTAATIDNPAVSEAAPVEAPLPPAPTPVYESPRSTYMTRQEVTVVSQREYEKRLQLKEKFDNEIRGLKGKKLLLIVFKLGGQEFAIEIDKTKEVVKTPEISPVPHLPEHMVGVANVRGRVVLIMDLGRKFRITDGAAKWEDPYSIVIQHAGYKIGLLVPEVPNTVMVDGNNISTAAGIVTDTARDETYIKGIVKQEGRMIFFLDIEELVEGNKVNVVPEGAAV